MSDFHPFHDDGDEFGLVFLLGVNIAMVVIATLYFGVQLLVG